MMNSSPLHHPSHTLNITYTLYHIARRDVGVSSKLVNVLSFYLSLRMQNIEELKQTNLLVA